MLLITNRIKRIKNYSVYRRLFNVNGKLKSVDAFSLHIKNPDGSNFPYSIHVNEIPLNPAMFGME